MSNTNDLITALVSMGAFVGKNKKGEIIARFDGRISTNIDREEHLNVHYGGSSINLSAHEYKIRKSEIILSPL